ncbi:MAG: helix-turn-helix transcriptional regulator [Verrucomicrobiota bacterium]
MQNPRSSPTNSTFAGIVAGTRLFRDYQRAFASASGLLPVLRNADSVALVVWPAGCVHPLCVWLTPGAGSKAVPRRSQQPVGATLLGASPSKQVQPEATRPPSILPANCASQIQLLELLAQQLAGLHAPSEPSRESLALIRAKEWVETHSHEPVTLASVAAVARMSAWSFSRSFHDTFGTTFRDFLAGRRIGQACQMLIHSNRAIGEIATATGFRSISQFNRTFRKLAGQSPRSFRAALAAPRHTIAADNPASMRPALQAAG